jgi:hypothetical protein
VIHESLSLTYEPASEPLHISVKWLWVSDKPMVEYEGFVFGSEAGSYLRLMDLCITQLTFLQVSVAHPPMLVDGTGVPR